MRRVAIFCLLTAFITAGCGGKTNPDDMITASNFQLDTVVTLSLYGYDDKTVLDDAFGEIDRLEKILSRTYDGSDTDRLAKSSGKDFVQVSPETLFLIRESERYSQLSGGLFDVTIGPLVSLWDIHDGSGHFPSDEERDEVMALVDHDELTVRGNEAMLEREGMAADFGAIAKGYIADKVKSLLIQKGVTSGVINLGGNVLLIGGKPNGENFRIGVQDPDAATGEYLGVVEVSDKSLVSSGPYERYFIHDGIRYHHILSPKTGFPVENELSQVTIISDESVTGDALSTTAFLMGLTEGMKLIDSIPGVSAIFVTKDKEVYLSGGFNEIFFITNDEYKLKEETP